MVLALSWIYKTGFSSILVEEQSRNLQPKLFFGIYQGFGLKTVINFSRILGTLPTPGSLLDHSFSVCCGAIIGGFLMRSD